MKSLSCLFFLLPILFASASASAANCFFHSSGWFSSNLNVYLPGTKGAVCVPISKGSGEHDCVTREGNAFSASLVRGPINEFTALAISTGGGGHRYCYEKSNCTFGFISDDISPERLSLGRRFALKDECLIDGQDPRN